MGRARSAARPHYAPTGSRGTQNGTIGMVAVAAVAFFLGIAVSQKSAILESSRVQDFISSFVVLGASSSSPNQTRIQSTLASPAEAIAAAKAVQAKDPFQSIDIYVGVLQSLPPRSVESIALLDGLATAYSRVKQPENAIRQRLEIIETLNVTGASRERLTHAYTALAEDYRAAVRYDGALDALSTAKRYAEGHIGKMSALTKFESAIYDCKGDSLTALRMWNQGARLLKGQELPPGADPSVELLHHIKLLWRVLGDPQRLPPPDVEHKMQTLLEKETKALLDNGPWEHSLQLPHRYVPGLTSRPWHSVKRHFPQYKPVERVIRAAAAALSEEYYALKAADKLFPETECIHDAGSGSWKYYTVTGYWLKRDQDGCSVDSPAACALLRQIRSLNAPNFTLLRAGYSAISGRAHLRPHCGMTNAQLKFHVGLITPTDTDGSPCAWLRVGNESRAWHAGKVLFFDDSYVHSVINHCDTERVVFQVVFAHPEFANPSSLFGAEGD